MGKEGELWDDSALINAFEDAMSKYKKMHGNQVHLNSSAADGKKITPGSASADAAGAAESNAAAAATTISLQNTREADDNSNVAWNLAPESEETNTLSPVKQDHCADALDPGSLVGSSNAPSAQAFYNYPCSQGARDYNQLLAQYYELEEERQKILQQLNQFGACSYQCPAQGSAASAPQLASSYASHDHSVPAAAQSCLSAAACSCCPYACHCLVAPCCSFPPYSTATMCSAMAVPNKTSPPIDDDVIKTAKGAAERAISSIKMGISVVNSGIEEKEERKDGEGVVSESTSSRTDLSVVFNAWYSAGFYTGKYLTEQSISKKWQG